MKDQEDGRYLLCIFPLNTQMPLGAKFPGYTPASQRHLSLGEKENVGQVSSTDEFWNTGMKDFVMKTHTKITRWVGSG